MDQFSSDYGHLQHQIWDEKFQVVPIDDDKVSGEISKHKDKKIILLIGNPGRGKSTFFNILTGGSNSKAGKSDKSITKSVILAVSDKYCVIDTPGSSDDVDAFWHTVHMIGSIHFCFLFPSMEGRLSDSMPVSMTIDQFNFNKSDQFMILSRSEPDDPLDKYKKFTNFKVMASEDGKVVNNSMVIRDKLKAINFELRLELLSISKLLDKLRTLDDDVKNLRAENDVLKTLLVQALSDGSTINTSGQTYQSVPSNIAIEVKDKLDVNFKPRDIPVWHRFAVCVPLVSGVTGNIAISKANDKAQGDAGVANQVHGANKVVKLIADKYNNQLSNIKQTIKVTKDDLKAAKDKEISDEVNKRIKEYEALKANSSKPVNADQ